LRNEGKIVTIDIKTGTFEAVENILSATNRLFEQYPDAQPWVIRIRHRALLFWDMESGEAIMMQGIVNPRCEATLSLIIGNVSGQRQEQG
jgi:hypothetical protein